MPKQADLGEIRIRMDAVLRIMLDFQRTTNEAKIGDQILLLWDSGLSQADACRILGVDPDQAVSYMKRADNQSLLQKLKRREKSKKQ